MTTCCATFPATARPRHEAKTPSNTKVVVAAAEGEEPGPEPPVRGEGRGEAVAELDSS